MTRIWYDDGTYKDVRDESVWEYVNDPDFVRVEPLVNAKSGLMH